MADIMVPIGAVTGGVTGAFAGWLVSRRRDPSEAARLSDPTDPVMDAEIDRAAHQWAAAQGMPEAGLFVARRIRFGLELGRRRRARR